MYKIFLFLFLAILMCFGSLASAATEIVNASEIRQRMGVGSLSNFAFLKNVKVAILDNGFGKFEEGSDRLPLTAKLISGPVNAPSETAHGLSMAQIVWSITGGFAEGPRFYLVNTNGFSNFRSAVDFVIQEKIDIVLYSQVWGFGSNFDGTGFLNSQVSRATTKGVIWINAAGNYGGKVFNGDCSRVRNTKDELLILASGNDLNFENLYDENPVQVTLSWSDFHDTELFNTKKDLDLYVYDSKGNLVGSSELVQRGEAPPSGAQSQLSSHAREVVHFSSLDRGRYSIRVVNRSGNLDVSDRFRVIIYSDRQQSLKFEQATNGYEIMPPADHPQVITVGEDFEISSKGPTVDGRMKPEILIPDSTVLFTNGVQVRGSSTAAAFVAGWAAVIKSQRPDFDLTQLRASLANLPVPALPQGYKAVHSSQIRPDVHALIPEGASVALHPSGRFVVLTRKEPLTLPLFRSLNAYRQKSDDILVYSPMFRTWSLFRNAQDNQIPLHFIEFRQWTPKPRLPYLWTQPLYIRPR